MAKYAILIYDDPAGYANMSPEAWGAVIDAHSSFVKGVFELGGSMDSGAALAATTSATSIRGGNTVTDGPFVETKEALGGFYVVEARDLDHAVEIAKLCPAPFGGVEVRPVVDPTQANPF
ncbi:YciI family protein [Geodermatophilus sp. DSM 44513]|uniref:YciI family protein n=1 Tax=Geodermatophilus sp. DSM 44513 TaxID=1528104 RepID=UPI00126B9425|nr:YciI family protein [Geodermatophilus sp. DSM 44513]WNV77676.1 YciI family protein [Geodermatophilus sp. DSM 44513]